MLTAESTVGSGAKPDLCSTSLGSWWAQQTQQCNQFTVTERWTVDQNNSKIKCLNNKKSDRYNSKMYTSRSSTLMEADWKTFDTRVFASWRTLAHLHKCWFMLVVLINRLKRCMNRFAQLNIIYQICKIIGMILT